MDKQILLQFYKSYKGEILGAGIGFVLAVTVLLLGILKAIFIVICLDIILVRSYHTTKIM